MKISPKIAKLGNPELMDDFLATKLGHKVYTEADTSITLSSGSIFNAILIPYQMSNGNWRLKFNLQGNFTNIATTETFTVTGILSKNDANKRQACAAHTNNGSWSSCDIIENVNIFTIYSGANISRGSISGDIELESKPSWAV